MFLVFSFASISLVDLLVRKETNFLVAFLIIFKLVHCLIITNYILKYKEPYPCPAQQLNLSSTNIYINFLRFNHLYIEFFLRQYCLCQKISTPFSILSPITVSLTKDPYSPSQECTLSICARVQEILPKF